LHLSSTKNSDFVLTANRSAIALCYFENRSRTRSGDYVVFAWRTIRHNARLMA
jgi:hypothetical protein